MKFKNYHVSSVQCPRQLVIKSFVARLPVVQFSIHQDSFFWWIVHFAQFILYWLKPPKMESQCIIQWLRGEVHSDTWIFFKRNLWGETKKLKSKLKIYIRDTRTIPWQENWYKIEKSNTSNFPKYSSIQYLGKRIEKGSSFYTWLNL